MRQIRKEEESSQVKSKSELAPFRAHCTCSSICVIGETVVLECSKYGMRGHWGDRKERVIVIDKDNLQIKETRWQGGGIQKGV